MQTGLFDLENRYASLSEAGDPLERLDAVIDWEIFRPILLRIDAKERKSAAGRKPTCRILMFKLLILQRLHNLSDERLQFQVTDRLSFMRFLGLELSGDVPDARTVWAFRESLKEHRLVESLFERLNQTLADLGVELKSGQIVDATFVPVPIQRNGREDNALIKADAVPIDWGKSPAKLAQKDIDARWTKKGGQNHYDYKNHINIDRATKLIAAHATTPAHIHDSQILDTVLRPEDEGGKEVWADSAYRFGRTGTKSEGQSAREPYPRASLPKQAADRSTGTFQHGKITGTRPRRAWMWRPRAICLRGDGKRHGRYFCAQYRCSARQGERGLDEFDLQPQAY